MRKKAAMILSTLILMNMTAMAALAQAQTDAETTIETYAATTSVEGDNRYKAIRLTPLVYNLTNSNLSDILVKDSKGENVPYFIHEGSRSSSTITESTSLALINAYLFEDDYYFDYKLAVDTDRDTISTSIEFSTYHTNFAKELEVYGSYDNIHWDYIKRDSLFSVDGKDKLYIDFWQPLKYTHYRLKLGNNLEQISFDSAQLVYSVELSEDVYLLGSLQADFTIKSEDGVTTITVEGLQNLRLCDITIQTNSMFMRNVSAGSWRQKELYNLSFNDTSYSDTKIPLYWDIPLDEKYVITIYDGDDRPIEIDGILATYYGADVIFEGSARETYTLEFGRDPTKTAPVYDIGRYRNEILKGPIDRGTIQTINLLEIEIPQVRDYRVVFNVVIVVVTFLLGTVLVLKLRQKNSGTG